jgi:hypothetical protein
MLLLAGLAGLAPLAGAPSAAEGETGPPASHGGPPGAFVALSNLKTISRFGYPQTEAAVHGHPSGKSRVIGHLRYLTGDGQAQVYLALDSYSRDGVTWILVPIPGRPNGVTGWVPAGALGELQVTHEFLRVDREAFRLTLFNDGRAIFSTRVGVGRSGLATPAGHFYVTEKLTLIEDPFYGPYAIGTSAYAPTLSEWPGGGVVGIHGTDEPQLIPGAVSHGCVRLRDTDIARLWSLVGIGTPIEIV